MNKVFLLLACLFLPVFIPTGNAAETHLPSYTVLPSDTSKVIVKNVQTSILAQYRNDKDFVYHKAQPVINSFWDKISYKIGQFLQFAIDNQIVSSVFLLIFLVIFVLLIILLVSGDFQAIFSRNKTMHGAVNVFPEENIEEADFDRLIAKEIENNNLNLAVRYSYLKLLQVLSKQQFIRWQKDKTNREYALELSHKTFYPDFTRVTRAYEYIWYGKFQISMPVFCDVRDTINQLIQQVHV